jgi:PPOX class probable F420-dependent enzyme
VVIAGFSSFFGPLPGAWTGLHGGYTEVARGEDLPASAREHRVIDGSGSTPEVRSQKRRTTEMSLAMSKAAREAFLAETRVGMVGIQDPGRGPLVVPVWYRYDPGGAVRFATGGTSRKVLRLREHPRMTLCVQNETPPYSYVTVEGPATIGPADYERDLEEMAYRYLGEEFGRGYLEATHPGRAVGDTVVVTLTPERWWSVDYGSA